MKKSANILRSTRNGGEWTESRYQSFIKSTLRAGSRKWPPKYKSLDAACVGRHINQSSGRLAKHYKCNSCKNIFPGSEVEVNHIRPVVPIEGFRNWDEVIERLFCEVDGLEVLCKKCHKILTKKENIERKRI